MICIKRAIEAPPQQQLGSMIGRAGRLRSRLGAQLKGPQSCSKQSRKAVTVAVALSGGVDSSVTAALLEAHARGGGTISNLIRRDDWDLSTYAARSMVSPDSIDTTSKSTVGSVPSMVPPSVRVIGVHMSNWDAGDESGSGRNCSAEDDFLSALHVSQQLGIPLVRLSFVKQYWVDVFEPFLHEYAVGRTPNPDILCNRFVKFGALRASVLKPDHTSITEVSASSQQVQADFLATGHYAQVWPVIGDLRAAVPREHQSSPLLPSPRLLSACDATKDQSDFLSGVRINAFKRVLMPLGGIPKSRVRAIASRLGLLSASRKDSYGICFVGKRNLKDFLSDYIPLTSGPAIDITTGSCVGSLDAIQSLTCGQGARIGGSHQKYYIVQNRCNDTARACVLVAPGRHHPAVFNNSAVLDISAVNWMTDDVMHNLRAAGMAGVNVRYRIRHRQTNMGHAKLRILSREAYEAEQRHVAGPHWRIGSPPRMDAEARRKAALVPTHVTDVDARTGVLVVEFTASQRAVSPGQVIVFYSNVNYTDSSTDTRKEVPRENQTHTFWRDAGACVLGSGAILAAGPSNWDVGLPSPTLHEQEWQE
jgi:tRNA (5-methylaminomethyl-2-thiouridylate)-methyltransferase